MGLRCLQQWICFLRVVIPILTIAGLFPCKAVANHLPPFSSEKAPFAIRFRDQVSPYRVIGVFVMPGELLTLEVLDPSPTQPVVVFASARKGKQKTMPQNRYVLQSSAGKITPVAFKQWQWRAPKNPGLYPMRIRDQRLTDTITLNIFVLVPAHQVQRGYLKGYRIGAYPATLYKDLPIYAPPTGFIEVTAENQDTLIAPHFTLKQFLCKQEGGYPKYVVLREELLLQLELMLERVNAQGYRADTFFVMSGYRTPFYNHAIGNGKYSRHLWGDAADIFIDEHPKDGNMDDLNQDGSVDYQDAILLYNIIEELRGEALSELSSGGLGWYEKKAHRGPFVHVDARGFQAQWGDCRRIMQLVKNDKQPKKEIGELCSQ